MRMVLILLTLLLLLVQSPTIFASGIVLIESKICDANNQLSYSITNGREVFCINGNIVDKIIFCKTVWSYENDCIFESVHISDSCGLMSFNHSSVGVPIKMARKLLDKSLKEESTKNEDGLNVPGKEGEHDSKSQGTYQNVGVIGSGVLLLCCTFLCPCWYKQKRTASHSVLTKDPQPTDSIHSFDANPSIHEKIPPSPLRVPPSPSRFSPTPKLRRLGSVHLNMSQVAQATRNFSPSLRIGEGGFGTVYKAQLEDGQLVAIKRAKKEHYENLQTEFSSEVELLTKIEHRNLVKLLGYVDKGRERLIITEYVANGTLRGHLDGQSGRILDFNQRLEIAIDIAHGLTYLHFYAEKPVIHRDVKSSNILLTESMRAKVADFGFARQGPMDTEHTHISTQVKGTVGYLDPEYMKTYQLTTKSDVYSFGILLVEILTGRRPLEVKRSVEERVTIRWVFRKFDEGNVVELLDPLMEETVEDDILMKMFNLAFQCAAPVRNDRPDMKSVGEQLWAIRADYLKTARRG